MQYGMTGEAFEALYSAFERGAEFTQEVAETIDALRISTQDRGGATMEDIITYIRSLGE